MTSTSTRTRSKGSSASSSKRQRPAGMRSSTWRSSALPEWGRRRSRTSSRASYRLDLFDPDALELVVRRAARILRVEIEPAAAHEIARRARGTPRIANRWLKRVRDYAQVRHDGRITLPVAREALASLEVDDAGLDAEDRKLLLAITEKFGGGPVGLETLAAALSEDAETIEDVYEPYLLQEGYVQRTQRGRV